MKFLRNDYSDLLKKAEEIHASLCRAGKEMGEATNQGAETYHDNAPFEAARDECEVLSSRMDDFRKIIDSTEVIDLPTNHDSVSVGHLVEVTYPNSEDKTVWFYVGSYMVDIYGKNSGNSGNSELDPIHTSYISPLGVALVGADLYDTVSFSVDNKKTLCFVQDIVLPKKK